MSLTESDLQKIQTYLALPPGPSLPSPPLQFLTDHLPLLPPSLALLLSKPTTPQGRTTIAQIRNRRYRWASQTPPPPALRVSRGRDRHPLLFDRIVGSGVDIRDEEGEEEEEWGRTRAVLGGGATIGKFGELMKGFEEEREGERRRAVRKEEARRERETAEEFESDSDEDEQEHRVDSFWGAEVEERVRVFERILRERWLDGLEVCPFSSFFLW